MPALIPMVRKLAPALMLVAACVAAPAVRAEVHRCTAADGTEVFTDRRCIDVGAIDRLPTAPATGASVLYRRGCSHTLQDLMLELTTAIDSRDVNRLAGVYDWTGMSSSAAYAVMDRLQNVAGRPLADVRPVFAGGATADEDYYPQTTVHRIPIGLRLEQTLANGSTPSHTVLRLRRYLGCWWVSL